MNESGGYCPICNITYALPEDTIAHTLKHRSKAKSYRIISRFDLNRKTIEKFRSVVPNEIISAITGLRFLKPDVEESGFPDDNLLRIYRGLIESSQPNAVTMLTNTDNSYSTILLSRNEMHIKYHDSAIKPLKSIKPNDILIWLWHENFTIRIDQYPWVFYCLTTKGFAALAGCLDCDLICVPNDTSKYTFTYYADKYLTEKGD